MTVNVKIAAAWKVVADVSVKVGGAWKQVSGVWVKTGGAWKTAYSLGAPPSPPPPPPAGELSVTMQAASVSGQGSAGVPFTSSQAKALPVGGVAPLSYAWTKVSGFFSFTVNTPAAQQTTFTTTIPNQNATRTSVYRVTVTDSDTPPQVVSDDVTVSMSTGGSSGGGGGLPAPPPPPPSGLSGYLSKEFPYGEANAPDANTAVPVTTEEITAYVSGGSGSYTFQWSGTDGAPTHPNSPTSAFGRTTHPNEQVFTAPPNQNSVLIRDTAGNELRLYYRPQYKAIASLSLSISATYVEGFNNEGFAVETTFLQVTVSGGTNPSWDALHISGDQFDVAYQLTPPAGIQFSRSWDGSYLREGVYRVRAYDNTGALRTADVTVHAEWFGFGA